MASKTLWDAAWTSRGTVMSTEMNSLATGSSKLATVATFDNSANLDQYFVAEFVSGASWTPTAGGFVALYALPSADGTNYPWGSDTLIPQEHWVCSFSLPASAGTHRCVSRMFSLGPGKYKFLVTNSGGASMPSSGSTIALFSADDESQ